MDSNSISLPTQSLPDTATFVTSGPQLDKLLEQLDTAGQEAVRGGLTAMAQMPEGAPGATGAVMTGDSAAMDNQAALQPNGSVSPPVKMLQTVSLADIQGAATFIGKAELAANDPQAISLSDLQYAAKDLSPTALKIASASLAAKPGVSGLAPGAMQAAKDGMAGVAAMTKDAQAGGASSRMALSSAAAPNANAEAVVEQTTNDTAAMVGSIKAGVPGATAETDNVALKAASSAATASAKASLANGTSQTIEEAAAEWQKAFVDTYEAWLKILSPPPPPPRPTSGYSHVQVGTTGNNFPAGTTSSAGHMGGADGDSGSLDGTHQHHTGHHNGGRHDNGHHTGGSDGASPFTLPSTTWNGTTSDPLSGLVPPRKGDDLADFDALSPQQLYPSFPAIPTAVGQYGGSQYGTVPYKGAEGTGYSAYPSDPSKLTPSQREQARLDQAAAYEAFEKQQAYEEELRQAQLQAFLNTMNEAYNTASTLASGATGASKPDFRWKTTAMEAETVRRQVSVQNEQEKSQQP